MKKFLLVLCCLGGFALASEAQCTKSAQAGACTKSPAGCQGTAKMTAAAAADQALVADKSVVKSVCPQSGTVSYTRKAVVNGTATTEAVRFDEASSKFVSATAPKACVKGQGGCCTKGAAAAPAVPARKAQSKA